MLPTGNDTENMEQSTLNHVFNLFGKGVTQMLQQSVNQQTVIDELRAQNRSLQTQVANLTASLDEVEDRIFVRLQNMQPTIYTREGIPIDDALDTVSSKIQSLNEKLVSNMESLSKVSAELTAKVDRDEFENANIESQKVGESFGDLSNAMQSMQKDVQQLKQDSQDSNDRTIQMIKFQIQSQMLHQQMNSEEPDFTDYVTKDDLREKLNKLKLDLATGTTGDSVDASGIVEYALSGKGLTEEKVKEAYALLQERRANADRNYLKQKKNINQEMSRLMKLAKNVSRTTPYGDEFGDEFEDDEEEEEEEETNESNSNESKDELREYRTVGIDTVKDIFEEEPIETRKPNPRRKRQNIGLSVKPPKQGKKNNAEENDEDEVDNENEDEEENEQSPSKKKTRKARTKQNTEKELNSLISKMEEDQKIDMQEQQQQQQQTQQVAPRVDEGKIIQNVLQTVMPRVESLLVDFFSGSNGSGIKLEKNEAKQLITQLSLLDSIKNDMKGLRVKLNMKFDRARAETELNSRITRDEFFSYLAQIFPENETLKGMAPRTKSRLPSLYNSTQTRTTNNRRSNNNSNAAANSSNSTTTTTATTNSNTNNTTKIDNSNPNINNNNNANPNNNNNNNNNNNFMFNNTYSNINISNTNNGSTYSNSRSALSESQGSIYQKNSKPTNKGKMVMKPSRNSNMITLNQKFLKGADGHYYLRDTGAEPNEITASMFGTDRTDSVDVNAAFDFQPFKRVEESANVVKNYREETPNDLELKC